MKKFFSSYPVLETDLSMARKVFLEQAESPNAAIRSGIEEAAQNGKLLRPAFLLLAGRLGKFDQEKHSALAAAVEMLHVATLIHDDIVDDSPSRRGRPSLHTTRGRHDAVLMGDYLFSRCFHLTARYAKMENARYLAAAVARICESEIANPVVHPSRRDYLRKTAGKTAVLFMVSCYVGAEEAGCPPRVCETLRRAGYCIGMGFQIIDDILDFTGSAEEMGKPIGNDLRSGIITLPVILALRRNGNALEAILSRFFAGELPLERTIDAVRDAGGIEAARDLARVYTRRAVDILSTLPDQWPRKALLGLTEELLLRRC